jgi:flagellar hook-associated protein 1 FlgK
MSVADASTVGLNLTGIDALNRGDRFLLQPVTYAAGMVRRQLSRPEDLAAASSSSPNGNALTLAALADQSLVGRSPAGQGGATITDAYASAMAEMGTRVQGATTAADISISVADQAEIRRSASDGVNLDEEAARLIQSQQAYQASAKVLQVAQSIFDTLLQAAAV